jgi:hypothetical protein
LQPRALATRELPQTVKPIVFVALHPVDEKKLVRGVAVAAEFLLAETWSR